MNVPGTSSLQPKALATLKAISPLWSIILVAAILRFFQLGVEGVWLDEMNSIDDAVHLASGNLGVRPLYYIILKIWMIAGSSDAWLRTLSVIFDLGSIFLAYQLCVFALGRSTALITALVMALSPLMINHAQEIRMYPMISFWTLAGSLALAHALEKPTRNYILGWAIARLLGLFTSPLMILMLLPDCVLIGFIHWRRWNKFFYGLLFIGAVWTPLVLYKLLNTTNEFIAERNTPEHLQGPQINIVDIIIDVLSKPTSFTVFSPLPALDLLSSPIPILFYKGITLIFAIIFMISLFQVKLNAHSRLLWLAAWALLPAVVQLLLSEILFERIIFMVRYLLYLAPYTIMLMAYGFQQIGKWRFAVAGAIAVLYFIAVSGGIFYYYITDYRQDWQTISSMLETNANAEDVIVNYTWMGNHNLPRYYRGDAEMVTIHLPRKFPSSERLDLVKSVAPSLPQSDRLWLVCQKDCSQQEEFKIISDAVVGQNAQKLSHEVFASLEEKLKAYGEIEVYLMASQNSPG